MFYSAESREQALHRFKEEHPKGDAFWIAPAREKALVGPKTMRYLAWWKICSGPDWEPHMIFVLDPNGNLAGSVPNAGTWRGPTNETGDRSICRDRSHYGGLGCFKAPFSGLICLISRHLKRGNRCLRKPNESLLKKSYLRT